MNGFILIEGIHSVGLVEAQLKAHSAANALVLGPSPIELRAPEEDERPYQPFFMQGSAHLLKYRERYFQVFSRHQVLSESDDLRGHPYALVSETSEVMMTSPTVKSPPVDEDKPIEHFDIAAIELDHAELLMHEGFEGRFFSLAQSFRHPNADKSDKWMIAGYPHKNDQYDSESSPPTFRRSFVELFGEPCPEDRKAAGPICNLEMFPRTDGSVVLDGDYDGLSGAPVFSWSANQMELWYRGMVITGGGNRVRLIRELLVRRFLNAIIDGSGR